MSMGNFVQDPPDPYRSDDDCPRQDPGRRVQLGPPGSAALFIAEFTPLGIVGVPAMADREKDRLALPRLRRLLDRLRRGGG